MSGTRVLRVGLTGGIASGKSTVADLFAQRGIPVIDTDEISRDVVMPGSPALAQMVQTFGPDILDEHGALNRRRMRAAVFADDDIRRDLEAILHPAIRAELERRSATAGGPYQILAIPLLVESGASYFDRVLVVDCSVETQLRRLLARDAENAAQAHAMIAAQATRQERLDRADDVIVNDGDISALEPQVARLHEHYLRVAASVSPN